jgi:predicted HTH transcriptional regulator
LGNDKSEVLDHTDVALPLVETIDPVLAFIRRNTQVQAKFTGEAQRKDIFAYPPSVVREAVTNAVLHADYATGIPLQVAIFDNRIEITNPGTLSFGMTMADAITGGSRLRNRVVGRVFRELELIEQWGSGLKRMISTCDKEKIQIPLFEEVGLFFRVTLYPRKMARHSTKPMTKRILRPKKKSKAP